MFFLLKRDFFTTKKDGSTGPTALESDGPYFEIMGQWPGPTINLQAFARAIIRTILGTGQLHGATICNQVSSL